MRKIAINDLRPAQLAFGLLEIEAKKKLCCKMARKELKKDMKEHPVTVVIGPDGNPYIIDGHHHAYLYWCLGEKKVYARVEKDFSKSHLSYDDFWHEMKIHRWAHLYDQFGSGPRDPIYLPANVQGMADDPYRSLTWLVKENGGIDDSEVRYYDFRWANFFRKHRLLGGHFDRNFQTALPKALKLARSPSARKFPGYKKRKR